MNNMIKITSNFNAKELEKKIVEIVKNNLKEDKNKLKEYCLIVFAKL